MKKNRKSSDQTAVARLTNCWCKFSSPKFCQSAGPAGGGAAVLMYNLTAWLGVDRVTAGGIYVMLDMSLGFISIVINVVILATVKNSDSLQQDIRYFLLANLRSVFLLRNPLM